MIKVVICEDDDFFINRLKQYLEKIFQDITNNFEIITFNSGEDLLENYHEDIDIYFLDIEMNKLTGMDVARKIREVDDNVKIIFTTALVDYVHEGYEVRAYRYLMKPIDFEKLKINVISCVEDIRKKRENNLVIQNKSEIHKINIDEILFVETLNKDIIIHTKNKKYNTKTNMKTIEKELNRYNFYRCHKSFLVNMKYIDSIKPNNVLINNTQIPISRYRSKDFKFKLLSVLGDIIC